MNTIRPPETRVRFSFEGELVTAISGQTVAAALLDQGIRVLRTTRIGGKPRGIFCGIGICFDCLVIIDGLPDQRACITEIREGMEVETQNGAGGNK